jgi:hypothetical protein
MVGNVLREFLVEVFSDIMGAKTYEVHSYLCY